MFKKKIRGLATFWKFCFVKDFMNFKARLPQWNVKIFSRKFAGVIFLPKSSSCEFAVGIWKSEERKMLPNIYLYIYIYIYIWVLLSPLTFSNPDGELTAGRIWWKNNTYKITGKNFDVSLGQFYFEALKSLTNQNFQNVARTLIFFFFKRSLSKSRLTT